MIYYQKKLTFNSQKTNRLLIVDLQRKLTIDSQRKLTIDSQRNYPFNTYFINMKFIIVYVI